jgi:quercetin dioxygenase-like cupin family protein
MHKTPRTLLLALLLSLFLGSAHAKEADYTAEILAKSTQSWDGALLPHYPEGTPEITIVKITIAPGAKLPLHQHPFINAGILLSGALNVITDKNETLHLKAGDALIEVVDKWHYGENKGDTPAEIVVFYAGIADVPVTANKD